MISPPNNCGLGNYQGKGFIGSFFDKNEFIQNYISECVCKRHTHASHTSTYTHKDKHTANVLLGTSYHVLKSATFPLCLTSYFFGGSTFSSKKPWLTTFPAGKYLATTKEDPSLADAFPTPIFFVFFHTMAVKCPVGEQAGGEGNRLVIRA